MSTKMKTIKESKEREGIEEPQMRYRYDILQAMAKALGLSRRSIERRVQELVEKGHLRKDEQISYGTIHSALRGDNLNVDSLIAISKFFNVPMVRLFDYHDELVWAREEKAS